MKKKRRKEIEMFFSSFFFRLPKDISQLDLPIESKPSRLFDIAFMKKVCQIDLENLETFVVLFFQFGRLFLTQLYQSILMDNNSKDIYHALYCLLNLVTLEAADKDVLVDVIHFCFEVQVKRNEIFSHHFSCFSSVNFDENVGLAR